MTSKEFNKVDEKVLEDANFTRFCYVMARLITKYIDGVEIPERVIKALEEGSEAAS